MYWKTINMLLKNEQPVNDIPPLQDPNNDFNLSYEATDKSEILNKYFCSISSLNDENKDIPEFDKSCRA